MFKRKVSAIFYIISAELLFSISALLVKILSQQYAISAMEAAFARFAIGFVGLLLFMAMTGARVRPKNTKALISRGVLNSLAVLLYYIGLKLTTLTKANILNMTYPLFVAMLAPLLIKEKTTKHKIFLLLIAFIGIYLVVDPSFKVLQIGDLFALGSGMVAAFAVISLRTARKTDTTLNVMFFLMTIGMLLNLPFAGSFILPSFTAGSILFMCGLLGFLGQVLLTIGYLENTAVEASLASNSRIIFASLLGISFFQESLSLKLVIGAILIIYATVSIKKHQ
mgnify:CR=1 FL=1